MAATQLVGNSKVGELQYDKITGAITGFDIVNPNNTKLHIDLSLYSKTSQSISSANKLKESVYQYYGFLAEHVPAATALFENNAKMFPKGVVWAAPQVPGLWADSVGKGLEYTEKNNRIDQLSKKYHVDMRGKALMTGNLTLPGGGGPIETSGGSSYEDALAQDYLGKDGKWHKQTPQEALLHEHAHLAPPLQNFYSVSQQRSIHPALPQENIKMRTRVENETRAIEFVNAVMLRPMGIPERDPSKYFEIKPSNIVAPARMAYKQHDFENLHHTPIPKSLDGYSKPTLKQIQLNKNLYSVADEADHSMQVVSSAIRYVAANFSENQQNAIYSRLADRLSEFSANQNKSQDHSLG